MIKVDINDYVVVKSGTKRVLMKLLSANDDLSLYYGIPENKRILERSVEVEINPEDILACLGKNPAYGSVLGCSTEIYRNRKELEGWGSIYFYRTLEKESLKSLRLSIRSVVNSLSDLKLNIHPFDTEIRESKGKYAGSFKFRPKKVDGVSTDLICLKPKEFEQLLPLLYHEIGHSIWYRLLDPTVQSRWILVYHKAIDIQNVSKSEIDTIIADFVESTKFCKEFRNTLDERKELVFDQCLKYVDDKHCLSSQHLDTLIAAGHDTSGYFSIEDIGLSNIRLVLTEYAQVSPEEFFAEAFSLHMSGSILPKSLRDMMSKTIERAKNFVDTSDD